MCGICGYVGRQDSEVLNLMNAALVHRGPDDGGIWFNSDERVGFGHRRLSIIDLSPQGRQPMVSRDESIVLTYNGELYDYKKHRDNLERKGYNFKSHSDTEVVLYLYQEYGLEFLQKINGIFALAIWDRTSKELILARDHAGVKPLYYHQDGEKILFASEIKAIMRVPGVPRELNIGQLPNYLTNFWVGGNETMLRGVHKVEPGHYLIVKEGVPKSVRWFDVEYNPDSSNSFDGWAAEVREMFLSSIKRQMVSDAPLGAFLSGGLDSSSIVGCMREVSPGSKTQCYSIDYEAAEIKREGFDADLPYARLVAEKCGVSLDVVEGLGEAKEILPKIVYHLDEPDADPAAMLTYKIARLAKSHGIKVLLSGAGGDEVFFGYRSHRACQLLGFCNYAPESVMKIGLGAGCYFAKGVLGGLSPLLRRLEKFRRGWQATDLGRHVALVERTSSFERLGLYSKDYVQSGAELDSIDDSMRKYYELFRGHGELNRHSFVLTNSYLADHNFLYTDKMTMAASVEARVPFVDVELMRLVARIPESALTRGNVTKPLLAAAMKPFIPSSVISRKKTGFGIPMRRWITEDLSELVDHSLSSECIGKRGLFDPAAIARIKKENEIGERDHSYLIYALLNLELWHEAFIDTVATSV